MAADLKTRKAEGHITHLFGRAVKACRHHAGLSQEELAWRAGLHRTYVSDIERGARNPSLTSIEKVVRGLGITLASLFESVDRLR